MNQQFYKIHLYIVHQDVSEEHWWRGCKMAPGEPMECTQHEFVHHGHNVTVDECICRGSMCNKNMTYGK